MATTQLRLLIGDADSTYFTDAELAAFMLLAKDNTLRALSHAFAALSRNAAAEALNMAQDDLRVSTEKRAADYLALSKEYRGMALDEELSDPYFEIVPFVGAVRPLYF